MAGWSGRGDLPEPPPKGWDLLGVHPAYEVQRVPSQAEADRICRAAGVSAADQWNRHIIAACVDHGQVSGIKRLVLPEEPDKTLDAARLAHEGAHTWKAYHKDTGRQWVDGAGNPLKPLTPEQAQLLRAMAEGEVRMAAPAGVPKPGLMVSSARQFRAQ